MGDNKDDRKRAQLRLVVNNVEKRPAGDKSDFIPFEELVARRDVLRTDFYQGLDRWQTKAFGALERYIGNSGWPYGLDSSQGRLLVLPAASVSPELLEYGISSQDELFLAVTEDLTKKGLCLSLEMILPFYSEDDEVMEDAILYSPIFSYGTLFLEENRQDTFLDLIYRLAFPLYPPVPNVRLINKLFDVAAHELRETMRALAEYPEA